MYKKRDSSCFIPKVAQNYSTQLARVDLQVHTYNRSLVRLTLSGRGLKLKDNSVCRFKRGRFTMSIFVPIVQTHAVHGRNEILLNIFLRNGGCPLGFSLILSQVKPRINLGGIIILLVIFLQMSD